jgi:flagellar basal body-associated protein FliL
MSDEEGLSLEDVGAGGEETAPEGGKKAGFLPAFLIRILKWVAIGLGFIILGVTTTVITFSLVNRGKSGTALPALSEEYQAYRAPLQYDDSLEEIRGVTSDEEPAIFSAKISMGFDADSKTVAFELSARKREIQNLIFLYLSGRTKAELRPERYRQIQEELMNNINKVMREGKIKEVAFREFVVAQ